MVSTTHRLKLWRALLLLPFDNKIGLDGKETFSSKKMVSTTHRLKLQRALLLLPFDNKIGLEVRDIGVIIGFSPRVFTTTAQ